MEHKVDVPGPLRVVLDEVVIAWRPLLLCVARKHALQADTNTLNIVYRTPACSIEKVKADNTVCVDMWVPWDGMRLVLHEYYFGSLRSVSL